MFIEGEPENQRKIGKRLSFQIPAFQDYHAEEQLLQKSTPVPKIFSFENLGIFEIEEEFTQTKPSKDNWNLIDLIKKDTAEDEIELENCIPKLEKRMFSCKTPKIG